MASSVPAVRRRDLLIAFLILGYALASDTWFFFQSSELNGFRWVVLISFPLLLGLVASRGYSPLPPTVRSVLAGAFVAFFLGILTTAIHGYSLAGLFLLIKFFAPLAFLAIVAGLLRSPKTRRVLMGLFFWVGVAFALQTLVLTLLFVLGRAPSPTFVELVGSRAQSFRSYGPLGFGQGILAFGTERAVYRSQGWFGEPSALALFYEATVFFGVATLRGRGRARVRKVAIGLTILSLLLTFSTAAAFSAVAILALWMVVRSSRRLRPRSILAVSIILGILGLSLVAPAVRALNSVYAGDGRVASALGKSPRSSEPRFRVAGESLMFSVAHPEGVGFSPAEEFPELEASVSEPTSMAPVFWILRLGALGAILVVGFLAFVLFRLVLPGMRVGSTVSRLLAVSLATQTVHQVSAGTWTSVTFLLTVALLSWELAQAPDGLQRPVSPRGAPAEVR